VAGETPTSSTFKKPLKTEVRIAPPPLATGTAVPTAGPQPDSFAERAKHPLFNTAMNNDDVLPVAANAGQLAPPPILENPGDNDLAG